MTSCVGVKDAQGTRDGPMLFGTMQHLALACEAYQRLMLLLALNP
jgi:hypothetical protein